MRGTIPPEFGLMKKYAKQIAGLIRDAGMADMPVGLDYAETAMFHALQEEGLHVIDGSVVTANLGVNPSLTITAMAERATALWPNKGEADPRPPLGEAYEAVSPVAPLRRP